MRRPVDPANQGGEAPAPEAVMERVHAFMHLYRSLQHRALRGTPQQMTPMEARVLGFFGRQPGATLSELVAHSGRDKGQLARLVGGLRERGLLEARADEADRRSVRIHLTKEGQAVGQGLRRHARRLAGVAVKGFSDEERRQLAALLERMQANLEQGGEGRS